MTKRPIQSIALAKNSAMVRKAPTHPPADSKCVSIVPSRRTFLKAAALVSATTLMGCGLQRPALQSTVFPLGVASGDPLADGFVLWTRLVDPQTNFHNRKIPFEWEVAEDQTFSRIADRGAAIAVADTAYTLHVIAQGLKPDRPYWYRFHALGDTIAGRSRTAPAPGTLTSRLTFAFASCQRFEHGYYAAHRHLAAEDLNAVFFLGDYIYETLSARARIRSHGEVIEPETLADYRRRYAIYKSDPDLQAAHAAHPWISIWDDHEVQDDYAADQSKRDIDPTAFLRRRAAAYRAWWEHTPTRLMAPAIGDSNLQIYRGFDYGALAQVSFLDTRQYRTVHACRKPNRGGNQHIPVSSCAELSSPARTMLGTTQETWLADQLRQAKARWTLIAQQTLVAPLYHGAASDPIVATDAWSGYPAARERLLDAIEKSGAANPILLGGDVHMHVAADLRRDGENPSSPIVVSEFVGTSISSEGPPSVPLNKNPHIKYANSKKRGYGKLTLSTDHAVADFMVLDNVADPYSSIAVDTRFALKAGDKGVQKA